MNSPVKKLLVLTNQLSSGSLIYLKQICKYEDQATQNEKSPLR